MDAFRQKRSKVLIANRNSDEGNRRTQSHGKNGVFASDSISCGNGLTDADSLISNMRWRSSSQLPAGTPIKKLLAEEMSHASESRRRSQSVIARLMGLEAPPPEQPAQRPQRRCSEDPRFTSKIEKTERSSPYSSRRSSRRSSKEDQEFKDVFEVVVTSASKVEKVSYHAPRTVGSNITADEMAFIRQKFTEAKRLSTDDKLHESKEFHDAIEVLDSNRDLLLKFLQQPDSLFTKHLNDLGGAHLQSRRRQVSTAKSSKASDRDPQYYESKSGREKMPRKASRSFEKHRNNYPVHPYCSPDSLRPSKSEGTKDSDSVATRIVVLKPNLGKVHRSRRSASSQSSLSLLSDSSSLEEMPSFRCRDRDKIARKKRNGYTDSKLQSRGSQEIAEETMKIKNDFDSGSPSFLPLKIQQCGGDSSSSISIDDFPKISDITILAPRKSSNWNNPMKNAACSSESSVSKEAKRRLSRRWNMTHKSQEIGEQNRGSTLADMLSVTDRDASSPNIDARRGHKGFGSSDFRTAMVEPLGISSRDGWKDMCINNLSRSRSVPSSSNFSSSPKSSMRQEAPRNCRYTLPSEKIKWEKNKKIMEHADLRDALAPRKLRPEQIGHHSRQFIRGESSKTSEKVHLRQSQLKIGITETGPLRRIPISEASTSTAHEDFIQEHEKKFSLTETVDQQLSAPFSNSICNDLHDQASQEPSDGTSKETPDPNHCPETEIESPVSSKEVDQPSPVSTLEAPFADDLSTGSGCFESLSADLQGLRMQLQLLKLESQANGEDSAPISGDEDIKEHPFGSLEDNATHKTEGRWEPSYIKDSLVHSGYIVTDPETFISKLHSLESPVDPLMFEELEKRYHCTESSSRPGRRLFFDRLNSVLIEIYQQLTDPHPWIMTPRPAPSYQPSKDGLLSGLCTSLVGRDRKASKGTLDNVLVTEMQWLDLGDDFDLMGKEIERLLLDDIVAEVVVELM